MRNSRVRHMRSIGGEGVARGLHDPAMDELTDEDVRALDELEERALRRAAEAEIERRSAAMANSMQFWQR